MVLLQTLTHAGISFAKDSFHRSIILLSNVVSLILFGLGLILFVLYFLWYGWNVITLNIPIIALLCLLPILFNSINYSSISRIYLCLLVPIATMAVSLYAKYLYYEEQEELDYFSYRIIILGSCVFPGVFFSIKEKKQLLLTNLATLLILMLHDPLHTFFGVPYQKDILKESNYAFTNIVILITYSLMVGTVTFLKWVSEKNGEKAEKLIEELNRTNEELSEKNTKIERQNREIMMQASSLNSSQKKLQEAYSIIEEQKNLLLRQNLNLSNELIEINKDLSETNNELIKHNHELRQFSYTVSHNLRGPVASLIGLVNLFDSTNLSEANQEILSHIRTSVTRLDNVIKDLNKIIDIRHDIFNIRQKISLQKITQEILEDLKKDIEEFNIDIKTDFSQCPEIYSVRPMVHSILYNLISNAIKYRSPSNRPEITITSRQDKGYILEVRDNGLGIDLKKYGNNLFKLYNRFHYHTEGKGLGLYLVKLQAEALGGKVAVMSEVNRYTLFTITLGLPENVEHQLLYEEPYVNVYFDASVNALRVIWNGPVTSTQYRSIFAKCLDLIKAYNTPNYLSDITRQGPILREDEDWMVKEILPQAIQHGMSRIAIVQSQSPDETSIGYLQRIIDTLESFGVKQKFFLTLSEATDWLKKENEIASML